MGVNHKIICTTGKSLYIHLQIQKLTRLYHLQSELKKIKKNFRFKFYEFLNRQEKSLRTSIDHSIGILIINEGNRQVDFIFMI